MSLNDDPVALAGLTVRELRSGSRAGQPTKIVLARREYAAAPADVWDALTNSERLPRWFLPVEGDLCEGGRYQLQGNAGGVVERCDAPHAFGVTWEMHGGVSWLTIRLEPTGVGTRLELEHEASVPEEFWTTYGPGATGVGWDLALLGLELHFEAGGAALEPGSVDNWGAGPGRPFIRAASDGWGAASIADGTDPDQARAAAEETFAFYTGTGKYAPVEDAPAEDAAAQ